MGTWDEGLLDNDAAHDGLGDLREEICEDVERLGAAKPTASSTAKLGAAVGVLLQLSPHALGLETESGPTIVAAVKAHAAGLARLPAPARKVLEQVMAGEGKALAERPAKLGSRALALLCSARGARVPFGPRVPSLFAAKPAAAYAQEVARRCVEAVDEDFSEEELWSDLCREASGLGCLAFLLVLEPCRVPPRKLERWRRCAKQGLALLEAEPDDELDFHRKFYANLDGVLALLLRRHRDA